MYLLGNKLHEGPVFFGILGVDRFGGVLHAVFESLVGLEVISKTIAASPMSFNLLQIKQLTYRLQ